MKWIPHDGRELKLFVGRHKETDTHYQMYFTSNLTLDGCLYIVYSFIKDLYPDPNPFVV